MGFLYFVWLVGFLEVYRILVLSVSFGKELEGKLVLLILVSLEIYFNFRGYFCFRVVSYIYVFICLVIECLFSFFMC